MASRRPGSRPLLHGRAPPPVRDRRRPRLRRLSFTTLPSSAPTSAAPFRPPHRALEASIGLLYEQRSHSVCTAFCVDDAIVATAGHCIYRTSGERAPTAAGFTFRLPGKPAKTATRIAGASTGAAAQNIASGSMQLERPAAHRRRARLGFRAALGTRLQGRALARQPPCIRRSWSSSRPPSASTRLRSTATSATGSSRLPRPAPCAAASPTPTGRRSRTTSPTPPTSSSTPATRAALRPARRS